MKDNAIAIASLFASTSTLLCCALPTLLVTVGLGAVVAGVLSGLPWLVTLSLHKEWVFLGAGAMIAINWLLIRRRDRAAACPVPGPEGVIDESACAVASRFSHGVLWLSTAVYAVGFFVAFLAFPAGKALGLL